MSGLTKKDLDDAFAQLKKSGEGRFRPGYGIPLAHTLNDKMFREVGLMDDDEVAAWAWQGVCLAWNQQPMHPKQACAVRVAFARSGASGNETVANGTLVDWIKERIA